MLGLRFTPRVRGWSDQQRAVALLQGVFPADAGVVPRRSADFAGARLSPQMRGWSDQHLVDVRMSAVFPADAGVVRRRAQLKLCGWCSPAEAGVVLQRSPAGSRE